MIDDYFTQVGKIVDIGSKTSRNIVDYKLSRYACYSIVRNSNLKKDSLIRKTYIEKHNK